MYHNNRASIRIRYMFSLINQIATSLMRLANEPSDQAHENGQGFDISLLPLLLVAFTTTAVITWISMIRTLHQLRNWSDPYVDTHSLHRFFQANENVYEVPDGNELGELLIEKIKLDKLQDLKVDNLDTSLSDKFEALDVRLPAGHPWLCPIGLEVMNEPVQIGQHYFDLASIVGMFVASDFRDITHPITRDKISFDSLESILNNDAKRDPNNIKQAIQQFIHNDCRDIIPYSQVQEEQSSTRQLICFLFSNKNSSANTTEDLIHEKNIKQEPNVGAIKAS